MLAFTMWLPTNNPTRLIGARNHNRIPPTTGGHHSDLPTPPSHGRGRDQSYGGHSVGETPGPIPNPEAKTHSADGTAPGRVWESRTPPDHTRRVEPPHHTVRGLPAFNTPLETTTPARLNHHPAR